MDVLALSATDGTPLPDGESGELVCRKPFPNMPVMFWKDPGRKRYYSTYFERFPREYLDESVLTFDLKVLMTTDVWTHGDFMKVNPVTKGIFILGRRYVPGISTFNLTPSP